MVVDHYGFTQRLAQRLVGEGHPGLLAPSARCAGTVATLFNIKVLRDPRLKNCLLYRFNPRTRTVVIERAPEKPELALQYRVTIGWRHRCCRTACQFVAVDESHMVVKNWNFPEPANPKEPPDQWAFEFSNMSDPDMVPLPEGGLFGMLLYGVAGQNSATSSQKVFVRHFISKVNGIYYVPSYGKKYSDQTDFENNAVEGYYYPFEGTPGKGIVRKPSTITNICFDEGSGKCK